MIQEVVTCQKKGQKAEEAVPEVGRGQLIKVL